MAATDTQPSQEYVETVRRVAEEAWGRGEFDVIEERVADDVVVHNTGAPEDVRGTEAYEALIGTYRTAMPDLEVRISALSEASGHGRHTTTATTLFHLPHGGDVIDSPGIRNFRLDHLDRRALLAGFPDLAPFLSACRFADCRHGAEPGCAVKAALERGEIREARLESYQRLLGEVRNG